MLESVLTQCTTPKHRIKALSRYFHSRAETTSEVLKYLIEFLATFNIDDPDAYINYDYDHWHYWITTKLNSFISNNGLEERFSVRSMFPLSNGYCDIYSLFFKYAVYYAYTVLGGTQSFMEMCDDTNQTAIYRLNKLNSEGDYIGDGLGGLTPEEALDEIKSSLHSLTAFEAACSAQLEANKADKVTVFNDTIQQLFSNPYSEVSNTATYIRQNLLTEGSDDNFLTKLSMVIGIKELVEEDKNVDETDIYNTCGTGPASAFGLGLTGSFGIVGTALAAPLVLGWEVIKAATGIVSSLFSKYVLTPFKQAVIDPYDIEDLDPDGKERSYEIDGWAIPLTNKLKKFEEYSSNEVYFEMISWNDSNNSIIRRYFPDYVNEDSNGMDGFIEYFRQKWIDKSYKFDTYFGSIQIKFINVPSIISKSAGVKSLVFRPSDVSLIIKPKALDQAKYSGSIFEALYHDENTTWFNSADMNNTSEEFFRNDGPTLLTNSNDHFFGEFWSTHPPIYADCSYSEKELWSSFATSIFWMNKIFESSYETFYKKASMVNRDSIFTTFTMSQSGLEPMITYPTSNSSNYNGFIDEFEYYSSNKKVTNYHFSSLASGLFVSDTSALNIAKDQIGYVNDETYTPELTNVFNDLLPGAENGGLNNVTLNGFIGLESIGSYTACVRMTRIAPLREFAEEIIGCIFHHSLDNYNHPLNFEFLPFVEGELDNAPSFRIKTTAENDAVAKNLGTVLATLVIVAVLAVVATFAVKKIARKLFYNTKAKLMALDQKMYNGEKLTKKEMRKYSRLTRRNNFFGKISGQLQGSIDDSLTSSELEKTIADSNELIVGLIN